MSFLSDDDMKVEESLRRDQSQLLQELLEKRGRQRGIPEPINLPVINEERLRTWKESMRNPRLRSQLVKLLMKTLVFADSSESFRGAIVDAVLPTEFQAGEVVFRHGEPGDWMGIVIFGRCSRMLERQGKEIQIGDVGPGGIVGDLGVWGITPVRSFTVTSLAHSVLLILPKHKYEEAVEFGRCMASLSMFLDASKMVNLMADTESFLNLRCFQGLDRDFVLTLRENSEPRVAYPNQILMREGHFGEEMYILRAGRVKILKNEKFVVELPTGVVLGELAVLGSDKRRTATVKCSALCLIRALHADVFHEILAKFPAAKQTFDHAYVARTVSVEVANAREEVQSFSKFYGSVQPKSSSEMRDLFGGTIRIEEKRPPPLTPKTGGLALPPITPRSPNKLASLRPSPRAATMKTEP